MKKITQALMALAVLLAVNGFAAEIKPEAKKADPNKGPTFAFQTFGLVQTYDLDRGKGGVGISALWNITPYFAGEVEGYSFGREGIFVDRGAASLRYNVLTKTKSRPYVFAGAWYNLEEQDAYGFHAGVGVAHQFARWFTPFADVRFHKPLNGSDTATSCIARAGLSFGF